MDTTKRTEGPVVGREKTPIRTPQRGMDAEAVRAVVMLAGLVRPTDLSERLDRSILELPVERGLTILGLWLDQLSELRRTLQRDELPVRILVNHRATPPREPVKGEGISVTVERDRGDLRGTGGVLRDVAMEYDPSDLLLVLTAGQILVEALPRLMRELLDEAGDIRLIAHADGTPTGILLIRCNALQDLPDSRFLDLKEQGLPRLAGRHRITAIARNTAVGLPVRTRNDYIQSLHSHCLADGPGHAATSPYSERWTRTFSIVEDGADVSPSARVHDSVVLRGGIVGDNATIVRSVVCPGGVVKRGQVLSDAVVTEA